MSFPRTLETPACRQWYPPAEQGFQLQGFPTPGSHIGRPGLMFDSTWIRAHESSNSRVPTTTPCKHWLHLQSTSAVHTYIHTSIPYHTIPYNTFIHSYTRTFIHLYIHTFIQSCSHTFIHSYIHTDSHTYTHRHVHINLHLHHLARTRADARTCTSTHTHRHRHRHRHRHMHMHMHIYIYTYMFTCMYTYTYAYLPLFLKLVDNHHASEPPLTRSASYAGRPGKDLAKESPCVCKA